MKNFFNIIISFISLVGLSNTILASTTLNYDWLTGSDITGSLEVTIQTNGEVNTHFKYNDRGRGPDMKTHWVVNENSTLKSFKATGVNYTKGEIAEQFTMTENTARWQSNIEQGQATADINKLYLPSNSSPFMGSLLAQALLKQSDNKIGLYPSGTAQLEKLKTLSIKQEKQNLNISLYSISGLDSIPQYIWLDENNHFFGNYLGWFSIIRRGFQQHIDTLKKEQQAAEKQHQSKQAKELSQIVNTPIAIKNVRIFDSYNKILSTTKTVIIKEGRIFDIQSLNLPISKDTLVIEGQGKTLIPALWDMHGHMFAPQFVNYVASGVLNVRDMANDPETLSQSQQLIKENKLIGPDIYPMGFIDKKGPFSAPTGRLAENLEQALAFVDEYAALGYVGIKLYSSVEPAWVKALAERAHKYNMSVAGHIPSYMSAEQAIAAGYDEITHINMLLLQLIGDNTIDTRTPQRFIVPGERAKNIDLYAASTKQFIGLLKRRSIAIDPTLAIFIDLFKNKPGSVSVIAKSFVDKLPPVVARGQINQAGFNQDKEADFAKAADTSLRLVKMLHDADITILPGTDSGLPGFTLISELEFYAKSGIDNEDILQLATLGSAKHLNQDKELGSVDIGKKAHLVLIDGNPLADISALRQVDKVIKGQVIYDPKKILTSLGFTPFN